MNRRHGKEGQKDTGKEEGEDVPKIRRDGHLDVLGHIGIDLATFDQAFFEDHQVFVQKDHICCFLGNINSGIH